MRTVLVSAAESGARAFATLLDLGADVRGVVTLPEDRLTGVSGGVSFKALTEPHGMPCHAVRNINDPEALQLLKDLRPDLLFVIGWSQILRHEALAIPTRGAIGFHPTLLPANRGSAPIAWTLIHGLPHSGVTLFYLDEGVDSGDIIGQVEFAIGPDTTARELYDLAVDGLARLLREYFPQLVAGSAPRTPQDHARATYWPRRRPADGRIQWEWESRRLHDWVRGLTRPYPGAFTSHRGEKVVVWAARAENGTRGAAAPGTVLDIGDGAVAVACADGRLLVTEAEAASTGPDVATTVFTRLGLRAGDRFDEALAS